MLKHTLTAAALAAILATPAFAQQQPMAKPDNAATSTMSDQGANGRVNFIHQQNASDWRGSKLIGASVYGPDNSSIGEINDVLIASDGKISAVVVGIGGFLGVGEKNVALPFDALHITGKTGFNAIDKITVSYTKDELKNAPKFAYYGAAKPQTTGSGVTDKIKGMVPKTNNDDTMKK